MEIPAFGGCLCGAVRYILTATPLGQMNCHCRACRLATGGAFVGAIAVPRNGLTVTGDYREFAGEGDSGNSVHRAFCGRCGSSVLARTTRIPEMRLVFAATLDKPEQFAPQVNCWVAAALPWVPLDGNLPAFKGDPPGALAGRPKPR